MNGESCDWRRSCRNHPTELNTSVGDLCDPHAVEYYEDQLGGFNRRRAVEFFALRAIRAAGYVGELEVLEASDAGA